MSATAKPEPSRPATVSETAVDRDRALFDAVAQDVLGRVDPDALPVALGLDRADVPEPSTWPCTTLAAERLAGAERRLDVDVVARREATEGRAAQGLRDGVERKLLVLDRDDGEAHAADRHRVAEGDARGGLPAP